MYLLQIDQLHNRLYLRLAGVFDERQSEKLAADLMMRMNELKDGFHVLCDLSGLERFDRAARKHYRNFMDLCRTNGVRKVIRVIPDEHENFGLTIMSCFHYENIPVISCSNFTDALEHLHHNRVYEQIKSDCGAAEEG